jgi:hypothetical protein
MGIRHHRERKLIIPGLAGFYPAVPGFEQSMIRFPVGTAAQDYGKTRQRSRRIRGNA